MASETKTPNDADDGRASDAASGMSGGGSGGSNAGGLHGDTGAGNDPNKPTAQSEKAATEQDDGAVPSEGY